MISGATAGKRARDVSVSGRGAGVISSSGTRRYALEGAAAVTPRARTSTGTRIGTAGTRSRTRTGTTRARTATARTGTAPLGDLYVVAIIESRSREVGLAAYNLRSFHVELRQFADTNCFVNTMTVLTIFDPVEIVLSQSSSGGALDRAIQENPYLADVRCAFVGRKYFNETHGMITCERLSAEQCPNLAASSGIPRYLALASAGALIKYVEHIQAVVFEPGTMRIVLSPNDGTLFLDVATIEAVELIRSARGALDGGGSSTGRAPKNGSLLAVIDKTKTRPGTRFLRRTLLEPPGDLGTILTRQAAVEELADNEEGYFAICEALAKFPDLEVVLASLLARQVSLNAQFAAPAPPPPPPPPPSPAGPSAARAPRAGASSSSAAAQHFPRQSQRPPRAPPRTPSQAPSAAHSRAPQTAQWTAGASLASGVGQTMSLPSMNLIRNVLHVKAAMDSLGAILQVVETGSSAILLAIAESLRAGALVDLSNEIVTVLDESAAPSRNTEHMRLQGAFAVRTGRNGHLDVARKTLSENVEDMHEELERRREQLDVPKLTLAMNARRGYHFSAPATGLPVDKLGEDFIQMQTTGRLARFSTTALTELNARVNESLAEIWQLTDRELASLLDVIWAKDTVSALHRLCDSIALLDAMTSLVSYCSLSPVPTVRPKFTSGGPIAIKAGYHPILVARAPSDTVPNDVFLSETSAMHIITGRNNAGKSTFLRSVALTAILAHTGCSVPAEFASVRLLHNVFTRFSTSDDINSSQSHHSKEMQEVGAIVRATTALVHGKAFPQSLVLIDELGRSTDTVDGFSIAYAVAERLAATPNVLTLFTTHFAALGALQFTTPIVQSFHLATTTTTGRRDSRPQRLTGRRQADQPGRRHAERQSDGDDAMLSFAYKVAPGALEAVQYGIDTARSAGFPEQVLASAREIRDSLPARRLTSAASFTEAHHAAAEGEAGGGAGGAATRRRNAVYIASQLSHLRGAMASLDDEQLRSALAALQANVSAASDRRRAQSGQRPACADGGVGV